MLFLCGPDVAQALHLYTHYYITLHILSMAYTIMIALLLAWNSYKQTYNTLGRGFLMCGTRKASVPSLERALAWMDR